MKTIIAGSRSIFDYNLVCDIINKCPFKHQISEVVSGVCAGVDSLGERWAKENSLPIKQFPANWSLGKKAGPLRNKDMANYADALVLIWDGKSKGTKHMIDIAEKNGLAVRIVNY